MKTFKIMIFLAAALMIISCNAQNSKKAEVKETMPAEPVTQSSAPAAAPDTTANAGKAGMVVETMDSGGYTYVLIESDEGQFWVAGPETKVEKGAAVAVPAGMMMSNFHSNTLDRDFDEIYFVSGIIVGGAPGHDKMAAVMAPAGHPDVSSADMPADHPKIGSEAPAQAEKIEFSDISKPEGGYTVAEVFTKTEDLKEKEVVLRGKVVKYNANIMGKNWLHLQDGSGEEGTNDLTITTADVVNVGDTVLVKGVVATDRDFGFGYKYDLMIEDAEITIEVNEE